jgi:hypothetical protein
VFASSPVELPGEAEVACYAPHLIGLVGEDEADPGAAASGSAGAADAVHVGVAVSGRIEVDDVCDVVDVDPPGGDVGCDQREHFAGLEAGQGPFALALALVAMHGYRLDLAGAQALDEAVGTALGPHEHQRAAVLAAAQLVDQVVELGALRVDMEEAVLDVGFPALALRLGVAPGVARIGGGDLAGGPLQRRREEEGLALAGGLGDDSAHGRFEAHVEHAVGLVEDEDTDTAQRDDAAGDQVLEPPGGGDEDVGAPRRLALRSEADAAVDGGDSQPAAVGDGAQLLDDLARQLPGGGEDESPRVPCVGLDPLDQRNAEGERLARAGRRLDEQIVAGERVAQDQALDGERLGDVAARERADDRRGDAEIGKRGDVVSSFSSD